MSRILPFVLYLLFLPLAAAAQDRPNTILVMDGSGSMWGQIDGVNKIVIARDVVGELLGDFPADQNLGLTVYGHRVRGDCTDIETVVPPAPDTATAILDAVNAINPRGKTPMTDAIIAAAESLRYTEERATVILVSDGIETCNPDPCAAARALEEAGIDFTAHVVGFDVTDPEALAQMRCLADETGGMFIPASDAAELTEALNRVTEAEPVLVTGTFRAVIEGGDTPIDGPVLWTVTGAEGPLVTDFEGNPFTLDLLAGDYTATAYSLVRETALDAAFTVADAPVAMDVAFPVPVPSASVDAPDTAPAGSIVEVAWSGPDYDGDYIGVGEPGDDRWSTYTYTRDGTPLSLRLPPDPGTYEVRYYQTDGNVILAAQTITATPVTATVDAPDSAAAGSQITVAWDGPDYDGDYIGVGVPGDDRWSTYTYTRAGTPLTLQLPPEAGDYEIRYYQTQGNRILAARPITLTDVVATIDAPDSAPAGSQVTVAWDGPDYDGDYIGVGVPGDDGWSNYTYTRDGTPLDVRMPTEPGDYEIRYYQTQGNVILARRTITLTEATAALTAPDRAVAGQTITLGWDGPDYDRDYIGVARVDEDRYVNYTYTNEGNPLDLLMPTEPGTYELRYYLQQGDVILARRTITLDAVKVTLDAPAAAVAGDTVTVGWDGPGYDRDYIGVARVDEDRYLNYTYVSEGNPVDLLMPVEPGEYEIRYYLQQGDVIEQRSAITVSDVSATLGGPDSGPAGTEITVGWDGPDYDRDYIGIARPDEDRYVNYTYTNEGNPLMLALPDEPGEYELRYYMQQRDRIIARVPFTVTAD